jgi:hypothetical protein
MKVVLSIILIFFCINLKAQNNSLKVFYAEKSELIVIQSKGIITDNLIIRLYDSLGNKLQETTLYQGSTIAYLDTQTLYNGKYFVKITMPKEEIKEEIYINK